MAAAATADGEVGRDEAQVAYGPQGLRPPLSSLVCAELRPGQDAAVVPLSLVEQGDCEASLDLAFFWRRHVDPAAMKESLAKVLAIFPCCAGRYVQRDVDVEPSTGVLVRERRMCILCNNAGVGFSHRRFQCKHPPIVGPISGLFDRAIGTVPKAGGGGQPLLRAALLDYEDGQVLALSFSHGLSDVAGIGFLLQSWSRLFLGEDPGPLSDDARVVLEGAVNNGFPSLEADYVKLYRRELGNRALAHKAAAAAAERPGVASVLLSRRQLQSLAESYSKTLRKRHLIFDSDTLDDAEVAFAEVLEAVGQAVSASVWLDYRDAFGYERLFGHIRGIADVELPADFLEAVALMRKSLQVPRKSCDFWSWRAKQQQVSPAEPTAEIIFSSWLQAADLRVCGFGDIEPLGAGLGESFWQRWVANPEVRYRAGAGGTVGGNGQGCTSLVVVLPHAEGVQIQALLPARAVIHLCAKYNCPVYYP
eukprot:TRINITY_DN76673_c0_g1_i1.p1 TRINITY_DN76673_c0_g1~~TRINITY_DN76673_c0_g1_i1.p1  ORF type:complete len:477 (-),score=82.96 TRINITY_DN76673_c0_g1_i1:6-1436(-)